MLHPVRGGTNRRQDLQNQQDWVEGGKATADYADVADEISNVTASSACPPWWANAFEVECVASRSRHGCHYRPATINPLRLYVTNFLLYRRLGLKHSDRVA